jgi:hypothetical protein
MPHRAVRRDRRRTGWRGGSIRRRPQARRFDHEIGAVVDQLGIQAHDVERRLDGLGAKKIAQQSADRRGHQHAQRRDVLAARQPMDEGRVRRRQFVPAFGA